jgi:hypothetical protein
MKKLFSVFLVLALCGIASATVDMYITDSAGNSSITIGTSDSISLYLWYTGDNIILFDAIVQATGPGTLSATLGTYVSLGNMANPNITATNRNPEYDAVALGMTFDDPPVPIPNSYEMTGAADSGALGKGNPTALAWITLHCDGASPPNVVISLTDIATFNTSWDQIGHWADEEETIWVSDVVMHGMTVHQIPEPATIALLCLGGLLLRKKK